MGQKKTVTKSWTKIWWDGEVTEIGGREGIGEGMGMGRKRSDIP